MAMVPRGLGTVLSVVLFAHGPARAGDLLVIESHVGTRPAGFDARLHTIVEALGDDALFGSALADAIESTMSRPAGEAFPAEQAQTLVTEADLGHRLYRSGEFAAATLKLSGILDRLEGAPAALVNDLALRRVLQQTRLLLGDIDRRMGRTPEGTALIADAIRADPESVPSDAVFNPDLIKFFNSVRHRISKQSRGSIEVITRPAGAKVYLNDEFVGLSPARRGDLYPGRHQVVVQYKNSRGRVHEVLVQSDERLSIDADFDAALRSRPWVGLWFPSDEVRRQREAEFAVYVGRALRARRVVVVASGQVRDGPVISGTMLDVETASRVRWAAVALEPLPPNETLRALGRFLVGGDAAPGVIVGGAETATREVRPYRRWKWIVAGASLAVAVAGALLVATDCTAKAASTGNCIESRGTRTAGWVTLGAAGALGIAAGVLFYYDGREARTAVTFDL